MKYMYFNMYIIKIYVNNLNLVFILMLFKIIMGFNLSLVL